MQLEFTPYVLPFIVSTLILSYLSIYAFRLRHQVESAGWFSILSLGLAVWTACYAMELVSVTLVSKVFWAKMKYLGAAPGPVMWFVFSLHYTKHDRWLTKLLQRLLTVFTLLTLGIVFTNEVHHWYWTEIHIIPGFPETQSEHGFYFWVYAAGMYLLVLLSVVIYLDYYRSVPALFRRQSVFMVLGGFLPLGARILEDFIGWDPFPKIDNVILFLLLSAILFALSLFRFSALELVPIAHSLVIRDISAGILVLDELGRIVEINPFAQTLMRLDSEDVLGKSLVSVWKHGLALNDFPTFIDQHEQELSIPNGEDVLYLLTQISPIRDARDRVIGHVVVLVDITDRKKAEMDLERLAQTDVLTGVTNRRHFFKLAEAEFARARRYHHALAVLLLDVDHFKQVNDRFGHLAGDSILQRIATECKGHLRGTDVFARYGGEEYICLLPEQDKAGALETAERIRRTVEETREESDGQSICVTISVGLALLSDESGLTLERLIDRADQALYQSKTHGRNRVSLWGETASLAAATNV